ncbi:MULTISPECIES: hypothetical protein [unclassified Veillonella]|jgi:hypothetical protein|uniref:hypothetical protein n=2 Tax=Veillonella TaxID=29465 RepID=UPI00021A3C19|nr:MULTISPECIES: hypothetical protein [unclassified Veillonella]EGS33859.1 hypothetical protein HMPREF9200_0251 [Veillonella sp. oral taxon 780 str. F0422]
MLRWKGQKKNGFVSYMILLIAMMTIGTWVAWLHTMQITYQSMMDEYRFVRCQYGIERGIVLGTNKKFFLAHQKEITGSGSPKYVLEETDTERIEAILYKEQEEQLYCLRLLCTDVETETNIKKDVYIKTIYKNDILETIQIEWVRE